jgi:hypothetical protein
VDRNQPDGTPTWIDLAIPDLDRAMGFYRAWLVRGRACGDRALHDTSAGRECGCGADAGPDPAADAACRNVYFAADECDRRVSECSQRPGGRADRPGSWATYASDVDAGTGQTDGWESFGRAVVADLRAPNEVAVAAGQPPVVDLRTVDSIVLVVCSLPASGMNPDASSGPVPRGPGVTRSTSTAGRQGHPGFQRSGPGRVGGPRAGAQLRAARPGGAGGRGGGQVDQQQFIADAGDQGAGPSQSDGPDPISRLDPRHAVHPRHIVLLGYNIWSIYEEPNRPETRTCDGYVTGGAQVLVRAARTTRFTKFLVQGGTGAGPVRGDR